jgi:hypothetical protein
LPRTTSNGKHHGWTTSSAQWVVEARYGFLWLV